MTKEYDLNALRARRKAAGTLLKRREAAVEKAELDLVVAKIEREIAWYDQREACCKVDAAAAGRDLVAAREEIKKLEKEIAQ
jgi:hypothetical protein